MKSIYTITKNWPQLHSRKAIWQPWTYVDRKASHLSVDHCWSIYRPSCSLNVNNGRWVTWTCHDCPGTIAFIDNGRLLNKAPECLQKHCSLPLTAVKEDRQRVKLQSIHLLIRPGWFCLNRNLMMFICHLLISPLFHIILYRMTKNSFKGTYSGY